MQILHQNVGTIPLETNTIISVIDNTILNDNVTTPISIPTIRVLSRIITSTIPTDIDITEHDVGAIGHEIVPLGRIAQFQVLDCAAVETDGAEEDGA